MINDKQRTKNRFRKKNKTKQKIKDAKKAIEHLLAVIEVPDTANDFYDDNDWVGSAVIHGRKVLAKLEQD